MLLKQLGCALESGAVQSLNIITYSGLNRYALQVRPREGAPVLVVDRQGQPRFWRSIAQVRDTLRRRGTASPQLQMTVPQDEVLGR